MNRASWQQLLWKLRFAHYSESIAKCHFTSYGSSAGVCKTITKTSAEIQCGAYVLFLICMLRILCPGVRAGLPHIFQKQSF